jgi:hypothetical protein
LHRWKLLSHFWTVKESGGRGTLPWLLVGHCLYQPNECCVSGVDSFDRIQSARGSLKFFQGGATFMDNFCFSRKKNCVNIWKKLWSKTIDMEILIFWSIFTVQIDIFFEYEFILSLTK